jgi:16S rRNA (cytosine1402-N4)-methyltransferase
MLDEIVTLFAPVPSGVVIDATLGGGGHSAAILAAHPHLGILGIDRDPVAIQAATERLAPFGDRAVIVPARFDELSDVVRRARSGGLRWPMTPGASHDIVGSLFDLGVSSPQLDVADRGFSYVAPGPLDMRMDPTSGTPASRLLDQLDEAALTEMLRDSGEGRLSRRVARAILAARPITTTDQLAAVVDAAVPAPARRRGHPAKRIFQALRIAVNDELGQLARTLPEAIDLLAADGRVAVLSYHSGEDRLVKAIFAEAATGGCTCPPQLPCVCGATPTVSVLRTAPKRASDHEAEANRRSTSARLRAAVKLSGAGSQP